MFDNWMPWSQQYKHNHNADNNGSRRNMYVQWIIQVRRYASNAAQNTAWYKINEFYYISNKLFALWLLIQISSLEVARNGI